MCRISKNMYMLAPLCLKKKIYLVNREVNPYAKVATLCQTFLPTFGIRLKSRSRCPRVFFNFRTISKIQKKILYINFFSILPVLGFHKAHRNSKLL